MFAGVFDFPHWIAITVEQQSLKRNFAGLSSTAPSRAPSIAADCKEVRFAAIYLCVCYGWGGGGDQTIYILND